MNNHIDKELEKILKSHGVPLMTQNTLGPFIKYFEMKGINEICINEPGKVWVECPDGWEEIEDKNLSLPALLSFAEKLANYSGQVFDRTTPMLATEIPYYNYRTQIVGGMSESGIGIAIRTGAAKLFPLEGYMSKEEAEKVKAAIKSRKTILISGGTSTGKTTMFNNLNALMDLDERVIIIEDVKELITPHPNQIRLLISKTGTDAAGITYENIIDSGLRMRPDRFLMGELTIGNTLPFLRIVNTGHAGSISTIHADSPDEVFNAISLNIAMSGGKISSKASVEYAKRAIDVIIHLTRESRSNITAEYYEVA